MALTFPCWIISQRRGPTSVSVEADGVPGYIVVFTDAHAATAFMVKRGSSGWEFKLICRTTLAALVHELRPAGIKGLCLDPVEDGCGERMDFDDLDGMVG